MYVPPSRQDAVRRTIDSLCRQTVRTTLEVILLVPEAETMRVDARVTSSFLNVQVIGVGIVTSRAKAMAEGVRAANAPIVAFAGNHSYPEATWAERLIEAHRGPWAAVGPSEVNANPTTSVSWAHFLIGHGRWTHPVEGGVTDLVPMTNGAFKRSLLLEYGGGLDEALERDSAIAQELQRRGHRVFLAADARILHFNVSRLPSFLRFRFVVGRAYAASRASRERWGRGRRLAYALGWPLIPIVQFSDVLTWMRRCDRAYDIIPRVVPVVLLGLAASAAGEAVGYCAGMGSARQQILRFESDLDAHMTQDDRATRAACQALGVFSD